MDAETRRWLERLERRQDDIAGRLAVIESTNRGIELAKQLLREQGAVASIRWQHFRDWGTLLIALCALLVATVVALHTLFG